MTPWAPGKACAESGCATVVPTGTRRCQAHMREYWRQKNAERPAALKNFYNSAPWRKLRTLKRQLTPFCEVSGCAAPAQQIDHIVRLVDRPDLALELANLRSLCASHHSSKTMTDRGRRG